MSPRVGPETKVLLPWQVRWLEDHSPVKLCVKSRQIGITWTNALEDVLTASLKRADGGMDCWYLCHTKDDTRGYIRDATMWAKALNIGARAYQEVMIDPDDQNAEQVFVLKFASGFAIRAMVGHPKNLRSKRGKVTLDEAAYNENAGDFLGAALSFLQWGGRLSIISTESHTDTAFHKWRMEIEKGDPARASWSLHVIPFDLAIREGLYRRICLKLGKEWSEEDELAWKEHTVRQLKDKADSELFCIPIGAGDIYIPRSLVELNQDETIPVVRMKGDADLLHTPRAELEASMEEWCRAELDGILSALKPAHRHDVGLDFGRAGDLTSLCVGSTTPQVERRTELVVELSNVPYQAQDVIIRYVFDRLPRLGNAAVDAGGQGSKTSEELWQRYGPLVHRLHIGAGKARPDPPPGSVMYSEFLPPLKQALQANALPIPKDDQIRDDLTGIRLVDGMPRIPSARTKVAGVQRHCDTACSLGLMWHAMERNEEGELITSGDSDDWWGGM